MSLPLSLIIEVATQLLLKENSHDKLTLLSYIDRYCKKLQFKMLDYTEYQKLRNDTFKIVEATFDFEVALDEIVVLFQQEAEQKLLNLQTTLSPTMPHLICSDRQRIQQMIFVFISTAIQSTQYGTINISVAFNNESDLLTISCTSDTGDCGTYPGFLSVNSSSGNELDINGDIGLSICRRICTSLGGFLSEQKSDTGMGHTYSLTVKARSMDELHIESIRLSGGPSIINS